VVREIDFLSQKSLQVDSTKSPCRRLVTQNFLSSCIYNAGNIVFYSKKLIERKNFETIA